ncbi:hypothetical protein FFR91_05650 [Mycoplasma mycoides subsp. mycoides]|uniref:DUF3800 domain-containing protein n=1 Tax=Mycoplasma mycoides TaxID=2102 RepID=UPI00111B1F1D|nr:DUF3800 domain-containing protein [Mycoplasma mycoides]TNJ30798.1 hypothetical protein FFR90_05650 [Mycoplasma mycoides subsp. mycoides]TNJ30967.1 hypothetical protein FFR91_05650 [Mycoplasma mycoides subsp. mycoides]
MRTKNTKYISIYLDESGSGNSPFFIVGGFFLFNFDRKQIYIQEVNISKNIEYIESQIKKNNKKTIDLKKEMKFINLTFKNKKLLFNNIKNNNQVNISMLYDLVKFKNVNQKPILIDYLYNIMVFLILQNILFDLLKQDFINLKDEISIKVNIDQRRNYKNSLTKSNSFKELKMYLNTRMYEKSKFINMNKIEVLQFNSKLEPNIRYADYYVGLLSSVRRILKNQAKSYDFKSNKLLCLLNNRIKHIEYKNTFS